MQDSEEGDEDMGEDGEPFDSSAVPYDGASTMLDQ